MPDLRDLLLSLDRCEHGRHAVDSCLACPDGQSRGNPILRPGQHIGYTVHGLRLVVPEPDRMADGYAWVEAPPDS